MKKIISLLVVTTMIFSMVASLNIMSVSADSTNLYDFKFFDVENQKLYTSYNGTSYSGKAFQISSGDKTKNVTYYENGIDGITEEPVLNIISDKYIWNNKANIDLVNHPVVNISFQYYIPSGTEKNARYLYLGLGKKSTTASSDLYNNSNYGQYNFYFNSSNNVVAGTTTGSYATIPTATKYNQTLVSTNVWHEANLKIIAETASDGTKSLKVGMYVDGIMHIMGNSKASEIKFDDVGIQQIYFNTTNSGKHTSDTYIKNIKVTYEDTDPTIYNTVVFDNCTVDGTTNALSTSGRGVISTGLQTSSQSGPHYYSNSVYNNVGYVVDNGALKITLTPNDKSYATHAGIQNFRGNLTSRFPEGTKYMQMSYDVMNPTGSESATKEQLWKFGNNTSATNTAVYVVGSRMSDNKITFFNDSAIFDGDETTRKSAIFEASSDKWYRIILLMKVTNSGSNYIVHTEGYVKDLASDITYKIYEEDETITKKDGADGFVLAQQRTDIITDADAEQTPVVTYYDNLLTRIWDDDFSAYYTNVVDMLPEDADSSFEIELNSHEKVNPVVKVRNIDASQKLILAAYNADGKMIYRYISTAEDITDSTKNLIEVELDVTTLSEDVKKIKAFVFDGISTAVPVKAHAELGL